jgi:hypothetical protein
MIYPSRLRIPDNATRASVFPECHQRNNEGKRTHSPEISIGYSITLALGFSSKACGGFSVFEIVFCAILVGMSGKSLIVSYFEGHNMSSHFTVK